MHLFEAASHLPPAVSQSDLVVYLTISSPAGLAAGELDDVPDPLGELGEPEVLPEPVLPDVPDGVLPELEPEAPLLLPLPLVCAAAIAGARAMIPTKRVNISFCIAISSRCRWGCSPGRFACLSVRGESQQYLGLRPRHAARRS